MGAHGCVGFGPGSGMLTGVRCQFGASSQMEKVFPVLKEDKQVISWGSYCCFNVSPLSQGRAPSHPSLCCSSGHWFSQLFLAVCMSPVASGQLPVVASWAEGRKYGPMGMDCKPLGPEPMW